MKGNLHICSNGSNIKNKAPGLLKLLFDIFFPSFPISKKKNLDFLPHHLQSGLEKSIERAIAEGDVAKAEEMSDRLATREVRCADKRSLGCSCCDKSG